MKKLLAVVVIYNIFLMECIFCDKRMQAHVIELVKQWSARFGEKLKEFSSTVTKHHEVEKSFSDLKEHIHEINGATLTEQIASNIRILMENKTKSVKKIADYAEFLSYYRRNDTLNYTLPYYYFNADNITSNEMNETRQVELENDIIEAECWWWCEQEELQPLPHNYFAEKDSLQQLFKVRSTNELRSGCDCTNLPDRDRHPLTYLNLTMEHDPHFGEMVNKNMSIIKVATNVFQREQQVLEGVRWSEPLDLVFKDNVLEDPSLTWQYFASPYGFMRHYPAVKWSDEKYDQTYDFRTRTWYTEAMTSPKDLLILVDRSGSMTGEKRDLSSQIVNNILDTLNDNDFVNVYTFTNSTEPLVSCFNDTLVQANEENLRLLRESLPTYYEEFAASITIGLIKAFQILANFRKNGRSSNCNQAIMLITEGIDYPYDLKVFENNNWKLNMPVRIFTYQVGTEPEDSRQLQFIACANMGYYVNMTLMSEIREKMLHYMNVMSRPINFDFKNKQNPIWTYLHVDLADRRYSNWMWRKVEGIRQRLVFLDHVKRLHKRLQNTITSDKYMLLKDTHDFEKYEKAVDYNYMTTVSLPVYGRRKDEFNLLGVAGVDVPIKLFREIIPYHTLGVNGYAFIVTNNGYVLMHPDHRPTFESILKPTFNRVDLLEVEILDDKTEPRLFDESIVKLRQRIVERDKQEKTVLNVKFFLNDLKRVVLSRRQYFFTEIGPFTLGIVLPDGYGPRKIDRTHLTYDSSNIDLRHSKLWKAHPNWIYCKECTGDTPEDKIRNALVRKLPRSILLNSFLHDAAVTKKFINTTDDMKFKRYVKTFLVHKLFLATHSGLTRFKTFNTDIFEEEEEKDSFEHRNNRAIDEDWYRRTVEYNYKEKEKDVYIYSVPFEISGYQNNTMITATKAVFIDNNKGKTPVAVVGLKFNHRTMYSLYNDITTKCNASKSANCTVTCLSDYLTCFILDNNAYIVFSDEIEYTGRFIGDIRADIMYHLIKDGIYDATRMFDYQAICQKLPPKKKSKKGKNAGPKLTLSFTFVNFIGNIMVIFQWIFTTLLFLVESVFGGPKYQSINPDTIAFEKLEIEKTYPTPCDHEIWLFNLGKKFRPSNFMDTASKFHCDWPYVVERIPNTNLLFLAINGRCKIDTHNIYTNSPTPKEINYNDSLPCYIAIKNNFKRRAYMKCYNRDPRENGLNNKSKAYCGNDWDEDENEKKKKKKKK